MSTSAAVVSVRPKFKTSFKSLRTYTPIHNSSGSSIVLSHDGTWLFTLVNDQIIVTLITTGERLGELIGDTSPITSHTITPSPSSPTVGGYCFSASQSLTLNIYTLPSLALHKSIPKAHSAPIITTAADPTGTLFASGSSDGIIKVWDAEKGYCTHVFKGHRGVVSALFFDVARPAEGSEGRARLISAADDCSIRVWDLRTRACVAVLEEGHVSVIRGLAVNAEGTTMVSGGRDRVINVWGIDQDGDAVLKRTIPVGETVEKIGLLKGGKTIFSGGDKGFIRLWDVATGREVPCSANVRKEGAKVHEIVDVLYTPSKNELTAIYMDQNIITRKLPDLKITRQVIGFNDEVIDLALLCSPSASTSNGDTVMGEEGKMKETHLAVATNSDLIRIYDLNRFSTTLLQGHQDVVLCLAKNPEGTILVSGSKDKTARIWRASSSDSANVIEGVNEDDWECIGIAEGHVESIGAVAISKKASDVGGNFLITASQDRTAKIWDLAAVLSASASGEQGLAKLRSLTTLKIHDKDINALDISPNSLLLASASQDRTAKLFSIVYTPSSSNGTIVATASMKCLGTFKGHKRGVWSVKFSNVDRCVATGSGDRTVKLWSLEDFTCLKTFEGHSNSVLRVDFITKGMQLVSCASDGLVKVWNVKDEECATTLDGHEEKIWALAISEDEKVIVSGGADSVITLWEDVTLIEELERTAAHESLVLKEQDFENYLSINDYSNAILLALSMDQPRRLLKLFTALRLDPIDLATSITGSKSVDTVIRSLLPDELAQMLGYVKDWNTVARTAEVAQIVLHAILKNHSAEKLLLALSPAPVAASTKTTMELDSDDEEMETAGERKERIKAIKKKKGLQASEVLGALSVYSERHLSRAEKLVRESFIVEFLLESMDGFGGEMMEVDEEEGAEGDGIEKVIR